VAKKRKAEQEPARPNPGLGGLTVVRLARPTVLATVHEESRAWGDPLWAGVLGVEEELRGAFVRILPPPGAGESAVAAVRDQVRKAGARASWVAPYAKEAPLVEEARRPSEQRETHREAVLAVARATASRDAERLGAMVEDTMGKVGM